MRRILLRIFLQESRNVWLSSRPHFYNLSCAPDILWRVNQMQTSTHFAEVSSAILSGEMRTAL
jgi:hypothetical protein